MEHRLGKLVADPVDALAGQQQLHTIGCRVIIADAARGSIGTGTTRLLTSLISTMRTARASAAEVAV
jgi:hypothetical protein